MTAMTMLVQKRAVTVDERGDVVCPRMESSDVGAREHRQMGMHASAVASV